MTKKHLRKLPHKPTVRGVINNLPSKAWYNIEASTFSDGFYPKKWDKGYYVYFGKIIKTNKRAVHLYGDWPVIKVVKHINDPHCFDNYLVNIYVEDRED